jgi:proteasome lid subunit RPN8/RPN11
MGPTILGTVERPHNASQIVVVSQSAYNIMMEFAQRTPHLEIIGIFFGTINSTGDIHVVEAYPFRVGQPTGVEFEDEDYIKAVPIIKECGTRNLEWLGWFHSHPFQGGDHLYMSNVDVGYHYIQQQLNPFWTALVLNPHQINDHKTCKGMRAFRLQEKYDKKKLVREVKKKPLVLSLTITIP